MIGLLKALGVVKAATAVAVLTTVTTFAAAQVVLPAASNGGQAHAAAAAANADSANRPSPNHSAALQAATGQDTAAVVALLQANEARLVSNLESVLARLEANPNVNEHAKTALESVLQRLQNGDTGLNRAQQAVQGQAPTGPAAAPSLPPQANGHPTASSHPGKP